MRPALAVAVALMLLAVACSREDGDEPQAPPPERPDRIVTDFNLTETSDGRVEWRLDADEAEYFKEAGQTRLRRLRVDFFREDGTRDSRLTADRGLVIDGTGDMTAEGNVLLVSVAGDTLTTGELRYLKARDLITGPGFVRLARPDRVLTGVGFRTTPDLSEYELDKDVKVVVVDREGNLHEAP